MGLEERTQNAGPRPERPHARADWKQMVGIGVVASILGIAAGLLIDWFPIAASEEAKPIDTLWDVLIIFSVPVFVGVTVVVLFSVWKFGMRPGEENLDGPPIHGNTRLEVIWTAIPAIILVGLCTYAFVVLEDVEAVEGRPMEVRVVGEQFAWTFFYERGGEEVASRELHVPIDRQVRFTLQSKDVLHDFWVPAFRMKKDAVPGIDVTYTVTPNRLGSYPIVCAELCGLGHAVMRSTATVVDRARSSTPGSPSSASRPRSPRTAAAVAAAAARPTARRSSRRRELRRRATRWPTRVPPVPWARISTTCWPTRTRPSSRPRSRTPRPRSPTATRAGSCRPTTAQTIPGPQARRAREVPF